MEKASLSVKSGIKKAAEDLLRTQLADVQAQLRNLQSASDGEGKSSAGDKYETQREMMRQSRDILEVQESRIGGMINQLHSIPSHACDRVLEGALVKLSLGWLWISVSLGKLEHKEREYQLISKEAPLFLIISGLQAGESALFKGKTIRVEEVI